ncbi:Cilia- and flagella-associated protein 47 [Dinochytrium kinnereticum]|nr:Cilia- and flagella-associated protein 47 [Dinochytrium kinnereticum]
MTSLGDNSWRIDNSHKKPHFETIRVPISLLKSEYAAEAAAALDADCSNALVNLQKRLPKKVRMVVRKRAASTEPRVEGIASSTKSIVKQAWNYQRIMKAELGDAQNELQGKTREPLPGSRTTIFTNISSASCLSHKAALVRLNLQDFFSVRVDPAINLVLDYEPGEEHRFNKTADISDVFGGASQLLTQRGVNGAGAPPVNPPKQRGMSVFGPVAVTNPNALLHSPQMDPSSRLYEDVLGVEIHGTESKTLTVPMKAYPAGPRLKFKKDVDFGVLVHGLDGGEAHEKIGKKEQGISLLHADRRAGAEVSVKFGKPLKGEVDNNHGKAHPRSDSIPHAHYEKGENPLGEPIAVDYLEVRNVGRRTARFRIIQDASRGFLKITPDYVTLGVPEGGQGQLGLPDTALIKIEFFYSDVGRFREEIRIELENPTPVHNENADLGMVNAAKMQSFQEENPLAFFVSATVVNHKLRLRNKDNTHDIDPKNLNFGVIYYSQCACLPAKLENRGPTVIRWVITHAGESTPMVPSSYRGKLLGNANGATIGGNPGLNDQSGAASQADAENKASMSVVPSEGVLNPYQTSEIVFNFAPRVQEPALGFKVTRAGPPPHLFSVPMQLKIITSAAEGSSDGFRKASIIGSQVGEEPIDIVMTGKACPIRATLSSKDIHFSDVVLGKVSETFENVILTNGSDQLGFRYRFTTAAHFHMHPSTGCLGPLESVTVKVIFKPNQLGQFSTKLQCIISSLDDVPTFESSLSSQDRAPLLVKFSGDAKSKDIFTLYLGLKGCCRPIGKMHLDQSIRTVVRSKNENSNSINSKMLQGRGNGNMVKLDLHTENGIHARGHRRSLSEGEQRALEDWLEKTGNRHQYWEYLKQSRINRLLHERKRKFGDDGVFIKYDKLLSEEDSTIVDVENGLSPPEPTDFLISQTSNHVTRSRPSPLAETMREDTRKIKMLFQQLYEPTVIKPKNGACISNPLLSSSGDKAVPIDVPLTGADLASIFTAHSSLDFKEVTVHSTNSLPLNFMNISPNLLPIHIRLLVDKDGVPDSITECDSSWDLRVFPSSLVLQPMSVSGVEVTFRSDRPGIINQKITYLVNGRYKYQLPVRVKVNPIQLSLSMLKLFLEVPTNFTGLSSLKGLQHGDGDSVFEESPSLLTPLHSPLTNHGGGLTHLPRADKTITLHNNGNFSAGFRWLSANYRTHLHRKDMHPALNEGSFFVEPTTGSIPPKGSAEISVIYVPGVRPVYEENLTVQVIDETNEDDSNRVSSELTLFCRGEIATSTCVLLTSVKQGPIDLGVLPVLFKDSVDLDPTLPSYNVFAVNDLFPEGSSKLSVQNPSGPNQFGKVTAMTAKVSPSSGTNGQGSQGNSPRGWRTIRIKNTSPNTCFFIAQTLKDESEVDIFPRSGAIQGSGGILELTLIAIPTKVSCVEDAVLVTIIGGGKVMKIPFKYESREPSVELVANPLKLHRSIASEDEDNDADVVEQGTVIGSWSTVPLVLANVGSVVARGVVDLRTLPEFQFSIKATRDDISPQAICPTSASSARASSAQKRSFKTQQQQQQQIASNFSAPAREMVRVIPPEDELHNFTEVDFRKVLFRPGSPRKSKRGYEKLEVGFNEEPMGNVFVFELQAGERVNAELIYRPTTTKKHSFDLPVRIIGMAQFPKISVDVHSVPSPIFVSKTAINFKNKVVFRDMGILGVSHLKNVAKECVSIVNNSEKRINWSFDVDPLEEQDSAYKLDPWHGNLEPGASQNISILFQPETIGLFETHLPLHIDYLGRHAPFVLTLKGTGVEPSIAFEPCEIFLPIVPIGVETTATFSIVNYGCERTEIKHTFLEEAMGRSGVLELQFPEGKLLKSDGEKLTVVVRFMGSNPAVSNTNRVDNSDASNPVETKKAENVKPGGPISFTTKIETRILNGPRPFRTPSGIPLENIDDELVENFLSQSGEALVRWLEDHLGSGMVTSEFPNQFISNPRALADLLQSISGKKVPIFQGSALLQSQSTKERGKAIQKYFKDLLNLMISAGAFVSCVKPEFLMSHEDYRRIISLQMDSLKSDNRGIIHDELLEYNRKLDSIFPIVQKEAWTIVLLQIVRVYVSSLVTVKHFRTLPGLEKDEQDLSWPISSRSSFFSTSEYILLRWASYHMWKRTGSLKRLSNFTDDFKNSIALASLILSHIPYLEISHFSYFQPVCETIEQLEGNCRIINHALTEVFSSNAMLLPVEAVIRGEAALDIQMLLLFLYQTLPHFLPKALVEFHGGLHDKVIRSIEISNPSSRSLTYTAHLGGSPDFSLVEGPTLSVPAKTQSKIPIQFNSRFAVPADGQLKLQSRKMGLNSASILVFDLAGFVDPPSPRRIFRIDAPMYCSPPVTIDLEITSPFPITGKFKISLSQCRESGIYDNFSPPAFKALESELVVEPNQICFLPIAFQPFDSGIHECILHFVDDTVGEFMYQIDGRATAPQAIDFVWTCKASSALEKSIRITPVNPVREKALYSGLQKRLTKAVNKKKDILAGHQDIDRDSFQPPRRPLKYKLPGKYSGKIVLIGTEVSDVRVFSIQGVAISEGSKAELDFSVPVRQTLVQDIPIVNKTDEDWTIKATIQGQFFTGAHALVAPAHSVTNYSITFKPLRPVEVEGVLTISNLHTAQKHVYYLRGIGQEPLPEDHRELKCSVRDKVRETFKVTNYTDHDSEYDIVTDIPNVNCIRRVFVPSNQSIDHPIEIHPKKSGQSTHLVTFVNRTDHSYTWYTVRMVVKPPPCEETIRLSTTVRKAVAVEIPIQNPLDSAVVFDVKFTGEGLVGPAKVGAEAKGETIYVLSYAPISSAMESGKLMFQNDLIGEFWYDLQLEAKEAPPIILPGMSAPLGKCSGTGLLPEPMDEIVVRAQLNHSVSSILSFTNPLLDPIPVSITIKDDESLQPGHNPDISLMIHKKPRYNVGGLERLDIPFVYTPKKMDRTIVSIIVEMGKLKWVYPVTGMPDAPITTATQVLECRSRDTFDTEFQLMLPGFIVEPEGLLSTNQIDWGSRIGYSLFTGTVERNDLKKIVHLELVDSKFVEKEGLALLFKVTFSPVRPSDQLTTLTITHHATGARYKFPLRLIAHPPLIDDTIVIEGAINKTMGVSFVLKNAASHKRSFKAFFSRDTPGEFSVHPTHGVLVPESERGEGENVFVVTYRAVSYGKNVFGTLLIEADDISWSYEIRGVTPKTHHPTTNSVEPRYSFLSNTSSSMVRLPLLPGGTTAPDALSVGGGRKKNFLRENVVQVAKMGKR